MRTLRTHAPARHNPPHQTHDGTEAEHSTASTTHHDSFSRPIISLHQPAIHRCRRYGLKRGGRRLWKPKGTRTTGHRPGQQVRVGLMWTRHKCSKQRDSSGLHSSVLLWEPFSGHWDAVTTATKGGGYTTAGLCLSVCLFVCLFAGEITQKYPSGFNGIFRKCC